MSYRQHREQMRFETFLKSVQTGVQNKCQNVT